MMHFHFPLSVLLHCKVHWWTLKHLYTVHPKCIFLMQMNIFFFLYSCAIKPLTRCKRKVQTLTYSGVKECSVATLFVLFGIEWFKTCCGFPKNGQSGKTVLTPVFIFKTQWCSLHQQCSSSFVPGLVFSVTRYISCVWQCNFMFTC